MAATSSCRRYLFESCFGMSVKAKEHMIPRAWHFYLLSCLGIICSFFAKFHSYPAPGTLDHVKRTEAIFVNSLHIQTKKSNRKDMALCFEFFLHFDMKYICIIYFYISQYISAFCFYIFGFFKKYKAKTE